MPIKEKGVCMVTLDPNGDHPRQLKIQRRFVFSSNVVWIGWPSDPNDEPYGNAKCMIVAYKGGTRYAYVGVSRQRAVAAANHPSSGKYINERIKPNYEAIRIR